VYNTLGQQMALQQTQQLPGGTTSAYTRVFDYDGEGEILGRTDGTLGGGTFTALSGATTAQPDALPPQHLAYVGSASVATLSTDGLISLSDGLVQPALSAGSADQYTVQAGDTLQSIAQTVYGNANLWYVIADANALSVDSSGTAINLVAGTTLKLPAVSNQNSKTGVQNRGQCALSPADSDFLGLPILAGPARRRSWASIAARKRSARHHEATPRGNRVRSSFVASTAVKDCDQMLHSKT